MLDFDSLPESDKYVLGTLLATGGLGNVYRGSQKPRDIPLAFKRVAAIDPENPGFLLREYNILKELDHPNIIHVYDICKIEGQICIVMEYFNALEVNRVFVVPALQEPGGLQKTMLVISQVIEALRYLHQRGIIHCTIAPSNILIDEDFDVRVIDFGHARFFQENDTDSLGHISGIPRYMAPEQFQGSLLSPATDFYAVGLLLAEILYGLDLFEGKSLHEVFAAKLTTPITENRLMEHGISQDMAIVLTRLLERNPERRLANHEELLALLGQFLASHAANQSTLTLPAWELKSADARISIDQGEAGRISTEKHLAQLRQLRQVVASRFNEDELRSLCFDLGMEYDDFPGRGKTGKAREIVTYFKRHDRLSELVEMVQRHRPNVFWDP